MKGDANLPVENSPVFTEAMNGIGKQFVNAKYDEFLRKKSINEVDVPLATDVATSQKLKRSATWLIEGRGAS
jgi:hypothetical protein